MQGDIDNNSVAYWQGDGLYKQILQLPKDQEFIDELTRDYFFAAHPARLVPGAVEFYPFCSIKGQLQIYLTDTKIWTASSALIHGKDGEDGEDGEDGKNGKRGRPGFPSTIEEHINTPVEYRLHIWYVDFNGVAHNYITPNLRSAFPQWGEVSGDINNQVDLGEKFAALYAQTEDLVSAAVEKAETELDQEVSLREEEDFALSQEIALERQEREAAIAEIAADGADWSAEISGLQDAVQDLSVELGDKIGYVDVVNDLETGGGDVPLAAEQGRVLLQRITEVSKSNRDRGTVYHYGPSSDLTWQVVSVEILDPGEGHIVGHPVIFQGTSVTDILAIGIITEITETGGVVTCDIHRPGDYQEDISGSMVLRSDTGTGFYGTITAAEASASDISTIEDPMPNDRVVVLFDETQAYPIPYNWGYLDLNGDGIFNWVPVSPVDPVGAPRNFISDPITGPEIASSSVSFEKLTTDLANFINARASQSDLNALATKQNTEFNQYSAKVASNSMSGGILKVSFWDPNVVIAQGIAIMEGDVELDGWVYHFQAIRTSATRFDTPTFVRTRETKPTHSFVLGTDYDFAWNKDQPTFGIIRRTSNSLTLFFTFVDQNSFKLWAQFPSIDPATIITCNTAMFDNRDTAYTQAAGAVQRASANTITGDNTFSGTNTFSGASTLSGATTLSGNVTSGGLNKFNGVNVFTKQASSSNAVVSNTTDIGIIPFRNAAANTFGFEFRYSATAVAQMCVNTDGTVYTRSTTNNGTAWTAWVNWLSSGNSGWA
jgi:hypothetical protein